MEAWRQKMSKTKGLATGNCSAIKEYNLRVIDSHLSDLLIEKGLASPTRTKEQSIPLNRVNEKGKPLYGKNREFLELKRILIETIGDEINYISKRRYENNLSHVEYVIKKTINSWQKKWPITTE